MPLGAALLGAVSSSWGGAGLLLWPLDPSSSQGDLTRSPKSSPVSSTSPALSGARMLGSAPRCNHLFLPDGSERGPESVPAPATHTAPGRRCSCRQVGHTCHQQARHHTIKGPETPTSKGPTRGSSLGSACTHLGPQSPAAW